MTHKLSNVGRIISEIVSAEAWHDTIEFQSPTDLFVAVSFREGRFQGGQETQVSFSVRLRRAEIEISLDDYLKVKPDSLLRQFPKIQYTQSESMSNSKSTTQSYSTKAQAKAALSPSATLSDESGEENGRSDTLGSAVTKGFDWPIQTSHMKASGTHVWTATPLCGDFLNGQVFDADRAVLTFSSQSDKGLDMRHVRIIIRCKAEDVIIDEDKIEVQGKNFLTRFTEAGLRKRKALARVALQNKIAEHGLELVDLSKRYEDVILAWVSANE